MASNKPRDIEVAGIAAGKSEHSLAVDPSPFDMSVVIPYHNAASTLETAIESVLQSAKWMLPGEVQQESNAVSRFRVQIVLVDDGSTDSSEEVALKFEGGCGPSNSTAVCVTLGKISPR